MAAETGCLGFLALQHLCTRIVKAPAEVKLVIAPLPAGGDAWLVARVGVVYCRGLGQPWKLVVTFLCPDWGQNQRYKENYFLHEYLLNINSHSGLVNPVQSTLDKTV